MNDNSEMEPKGNQQGITIALQNPIRKFGICIYLLNAAGENCYIKAS